VTTNTLHKRTIVTGVLVFVFLGLALQLINLQIIQRAKYLEHSNKNRIRRLRLEAPRGILYDRNGKVLVENQPTYSLSAVPFEVRNNPSVLQFLSELLHEPADKLKAKLKEADNPFFPVRLRRDIDYQTMIRVEERKLTLPGVVFEVETKRVYTSGIKAPHVFGYTGEVSRNELARRKTEGLMQGDLVGRDGLEKTYDRDLRGIVGYNFVEVDAVGREVRDILGGGESLPTRGKDFYLTMDAALQALGDSLLSGKRGAVVMLDARDGGVLAMCSKPDYDPDLFSGVMSNEQWQALVNDQDKPLLDRIIKSSYPPGSTFKMVSVAAALDHHHCGPEHAVVCHGGVTFGSKTFLCHGGKGHGGLDMYDALRYSCNSYFYNLGLMIGVDDWAEEADQFGFGKPTGIDLPHEESGILPNRNYLDRVFGVRGWTNGMMLNLAIGQGDLLVTPMQMAQYVLLIANRGWCFQPHLVLKLYDSSTRQYYRQRIPRKEIQSISAEAYDVMHEGMYRAVNSAGGTGGASRLEAIQVCGKTGTAQNPHGDAHAWFVAFAPAREPEVAICVLLENAGGGGAFSAPIAGELLKRYFGERAFKTTVTRTLAQSTARSVVTP
jgi:penicillin-binding protein 2